MRKQAIGLVCASLAVGLWGWLLTHDRGEVIPARAAQGAEEDVKPVVSAIAERQADEHVSGNSAETKATEGARTVLTDREVARNATALAQEGKFKEAKELVEEIGKRSGDGAVYFELKGTVLTLEKDYAGAEVSFSKMLERQPNSHVARFNRAETIMLQGRFAEAEKEFALVEEERSAVDAPVSALARFKRVACLLGQRQVMAAALLVPPVREAEEIPAFYYARAMIEWVRKDPQAANKLLSEARSKFPPSVDDLYTDTFVELHWGRRDESGKFSFSPGFR